MGEFKKRGFGGGRSDFGRGRNDFGGNGGGFKKRGFGGNSRGSGEMFTATCAKCQKQCEVPFRPNGMKPVYCTACFGGKGDNRDNQRPFGNRDSFRRDHDRAPQAGNDALNDIKTALGMINIKLDKLISAISIEEVEESDLISEESSIQEESKPKSKSSRKKK
jgi:CxxC-x17-CxxC domain-containing protein